jgi:hypothetical protein
MGNIRDIFRYGSVVNLVTKDAIKIVPRMFAFSSLGIFEGPDTRITLEINRRIFRGKKPLSECVIYYTSNWLFWIWIGIGKTLRVASLGILRYFSREEKYSRIPTKWN